MKLIIVGVVIVLIAILAPKADAHQPYLSKQTAAQVTANIVQRHGAEGGAYEWGSDSASQCHRRNASRVACRFWMYYIERDENCYNTVFVTRLHSGRIRVTFANDHARCE
jgi:hypothetical protein